MLARSHPPDRGQLLKSTTLDQKKGSLSASPFAFISPLPRLFSSQSHHTVQVSRDGKKYPCKIKYPGTYGTFHYSSGTPRASSQCLVCVFTNARRRNDRLDSASRALHCLVVYAAARKLKSSTAGVSLGSVRSLLNKKKLARSVDQKHRRERGRSTWRRRKHARYQNEAGGQR